MKITIYTISGCPFSKEEKEYLQSKSIAFEEKNLETNREYLTEMLAASNNFAGTPVTKIEKDDGQVVVVKGFDKDELQKLMTPAVQMQQPDEPAQPQAPQQTPPPQPSVPPAPQPTPTPPPPTPPTTPEPETPSMPEMPPVPTPPTQQTGANDDALSAILKDLQSKASQNSVPQTDDNLPNIPAFPGK